MVQLERASLTYSNESDRFILSASDRKGAFQRQYYHIYRTRMELLKPRIMEQASKQLGDVPYKQLEGLLRFEKALVIGTIEKRLGLRPSILKELAEEERVLPEDVDSAGLEAEAESQSLVSNKDFLEFEDEKQIVKLSGNISMDDVATGCVVGLCGEQIEDDVFRVDSLVWPSPSPQRPLPSANVRPAATIAFISGLEISGNAAVDSVTRLAFTTFSRWLCGEMALSSEDRAAAARVERVIVAGDSIAVNNSREFSSAVSYLRLARNDVSPSPTSVSTVDSLISKLTSKMCVDVMSGSGDPAPHLWPQQPIHLACLPLSGVNGPALGLVTNPYHFSLADVEMIATSGQNLADLRRLCGVSSACSLMELLLRWQHLAPTAPDTLDAFPMTDRDPLILSGWPHVMVAGNQPSAESSSIESDDGSQSCLLISLPRFSRSHTVALLDLETMTVSWRYFGLPE